MDYKKIIKSQKLRFIILKTLNWVPDKLMIKLQYRIKMGRRVELDKPKRYTDKIQWYKLYYHNSLMTKCADKYEVREYIKEKGYEKILNDIYGVYSKAEEIDFTKLPNEFVLKTTNGSGTNIICKNKAKLNIKETKKKLNYFLKREKKNAGREWAYNNIKPKIICEKFLKDENNNDLSDYKFFCFNGKVEYVYIITNRFSQEGEKLGIFDRNGKRLEYKRVGITELEENYKIPFKFYEMVEISEKLSEDFLHVRVDLYNIKESIIFGELTFYCGSGYIKFNPDEFDYILGKKFMLRKFGE